MPEQQKRQSKAPEGAERTERAEGAPEGAPLHEDRPVYQEPGPDVSNADVDLSRLSSDTRDSEIVENPDPNPDNLRPAPGPSHVQVLGVPKGDGD